MIQKIVSRKTRSIESVSLSANRFNYTQKLRVTCTLACGHTKEFSEFNAPKHKTTCKQCPKT